MNQKYGTMKTCIGSISFTVLFTVLLFACDESFTDAGKSTDGSFGKGGSTARFAISGDNLFTVTAEDLRRFDISDPSQPETKSNFLLGFGVETIFPYGNTLFIGTQDGMHIVDISDPSSPEELSVYRHVFSCDPVVVDGQYAYVTLNSSNTWCGRSSNQLDIIDISNLSAPGLVKEYQMEGPKGLGVDGNLLFVCDNGLKVYDISDRSHIALLHHFDIKANDVIPDGDILLVTADDGLYQYSYTNNSLNLLSKIPVE